MGQRSLALRSGIIKRNFLRSRRACKKYARILRFEPCEERRMLTTFTVNSMLDNGDGANTTLREAVQAAFQSQDALDIIKFDESVFGSGGTILLTQGELSITESNQLIIDGRDSSGEPLGVTIDADNGTDGIFNTQDGFRIFHVLSGSGQIEINGLTLTGGDPNSSGGAIYSTEDLTVKNTTITGCAGGIAASIALAV